MRLRVGKIRKRLSRMLAEEGLIIDPGLIDSTEGSLSPSPGKELERWWCCATWREDLREERGHLVCQVYSYDRMTDCVRHGFTLVPDEDQGWYRAEVCRKGERP